MQCTPENWYPLGATLRAADGQFHSGSTLDLSANGDAMVSNYHGMRIRAYIYDTVTRSWLPRGQAVEPGKQWLAQVTLSGDGKTFAETSDAARVFSLDDTTNLWQQIGEIVSTKARRKSRLPWPTIGL